MFDSIFRNNNAPRDNTSDDMIGIIYARKSSDKGDSNTSLGTQVKECLNFADNQGIAVPDEYIFQENYTGMKLSRPELNQVLRLLRDRKANTLIVYSPDRLTRVPFDGSTIRNELKALGVRLFFVTRGEVAYTGIVEAFNYMQDASSEDWRNRLVEATTRGRKAVVDAGVWLGIGRMKYGFQRVGSKLDAKVIHVDEEARIVRLIFDLFVNDRLPPGEIADQFNSANVPTRSESRKGYTGTVGKWRPENIYNILKDEAYIGIMYANKHQDAAAMREKGILGKIPWVKPKEEWIPIEVPPMIDRHTFDKAQEILADGRSRNARKGEHDYLISRLVYCPVCGSKMSGKPQETTSNGGKGNVKRRTYIYRCQANNSRFNTKVCNNTQYKAETVDCVVWQWVLDLISNPRALVAAYKAAQKEIDTELRDTEAMIASYEKALAKYDDALSDMADLYRERLITKEIFREKKMLLDQQIQEAERRLREAQEQYDANRITDGDIRQIDALAAKVRYKVQHQQEVSFEERRQLIEDLQLTFKLDRIDGRKTVLIYWAIYETEKDLQDGPCTQSYPASQRWTRLSTGSKCVLIFTICLD